MKPIKISYQKAAKLEFEKEPMDDYYQNFFLGIPSRWRVSKIMRELGNIRNKKILDVGCEAGHVSLKLALNRAKIYAIDIIPEALEKFKVKLKSYPDLKKRVIIQQADARKLPFLNSFFDFIVATEVIEHMPNLIKFAKEAHRTLKSEGKVILTFPNENLRKKFYPLVKLLGVNTDIENQVTLYSYHEGQILKIFKPYFHLIKNYSLPFFFPITRLMVFEKDEN